MTNVESLIPSVDKQPFQYLWNIISPGPQLVIINRHYEIWLARLFSDLDPAAISVGIIDRINSRPLEAYWLEPKGVTQIQCLTPPIVKILDLKDKPSDQLVIEVGTQPSRERLISVATFIDSQVSATVR